jgi:hypothetical protein
MPGFINLLATKVRHKNKRNLCTFCSSALKKVCKIRNLGRLGGQEYAEWSTRVRMYYNLTAVTQEATTSFPTGAVLMPPLQRSSALGPVIIECLSTSCTSG